MLSIKADFKEKIEEAHILFIHLEDVSNQIRSVQKSSILKSAYVMLLYNIVESTTRMIFERIHESLSECSYDQLSDKIKALYIEFYFSEKYNKKYKEIIDNIISSGLKFPSLDDYTKKVRLFSGNIDSKQLNTIIAKYGIGALTCKNKKNLVLIKNKRNKLAHGNEMFKNSCRELTLSDLALWEKSVFDSMTQLITSAEVFLSQKKYLK